MMAALEWSDAWLELIGNSSWSSSCNCQTYARYILQRLSIAYPTDVPVVTSEQYPILVDWVTYSYSLGEWTYARKQGQPISYEPCIAPALGE